jgi:hypothetical protein
MFFLCYLRFLLFVLSFKQKETKVTKEDASRGGLFQSLAIPSPFQGNPRFTMRHGDDSADDRAIGVNVAMHANRRPNVHRSRGLAAMGHSPLLTNGCGKTFFRK